MGGGGFGYQWGGVRGYSETFNCPHGMVSAEHRSWGQNYEQSWMEDAWTSGFTTAYERMVDEAASAGAHGVVGVVDTSAPLSDLGVVEFKVQGTAVRVVGRCPSGRRTTVDHLPGRPAPGQAGRGRVRTGRRSPPPWRRCGVWANCVTQYLTEGSGSLYGGATPGAEIVQTVKAQTAARRIATERIRHQLGSRLAARRVADHHPARARRGRRRPSSASCAATGSAGSRTSTPCPLPVPRCACCDRRPLPSTPQGAGRRPRRHAVPPPRPWPGPPGHRPPG